MPLGCDFWALQENFKTDLRLRAEATGGLLASKRRGVSIKFSMEVFHTHLVRREGPGIAGRIPEADAALPRARHMAPKASSSRDSPPVA